MHRKYTSVTIQDFSLTSGVVFLPAITMPLWHKDSYGAGLLSINKLEAGNQHLAQDTKTTTYPRPLITLFSL